MADNFAKPIKLYCVLFELFSVVLKEHESLARQMHLASAKGKPGLGIAITHAGRLRQQIKNEHSTNQKICIRADSDGWLCDCFGFIWEFNGSGTRWPS